MKIERAAHLIGSDKLYIHYLLYYGCINFFSIEKSNIKPLFLSESTDNMNMIVVFFIFSHFGQTKVERLCKDILKIRITSELSKDSQTLKKLVSVTRVHSKNVRVNVGNKLSKICKVPN